MVETFRRSVSTDAELLYEHTGSGPAADFSSKRVALINVSGTQAEVTLGDEDVTTSTGARWTVAAGRTLSLELEPGEAIYGVVVAGTQSIDVLVNGR